MLPGRLPSSEVVRRSFCTVRDVLSNDEQAIALRAVPGDIRRQQMSFGRLQQFVSQLDLARFGLTQGMRLCICVPNGPEAALAFLACSIYCTCAPLNPCLTAAEVAFEFEDLPAAACIVQRGEDNTIVLHECERARVLAIELLPSIDVVGEFSLSAQRPSGTPPVTVERELGARSDVALVLHTSGTTAKPKIVPLNHENLTVGALQIAACLPLDGQRSVNLNVMPLYHIHAISINLLASLVSGASCVAAPGPQPELFLGEWLHASPAPTWYSAVPTVHGLLVRAAKAMDLDQPGAISHELAFARSESSMLPLPVGQALESIFGIHVSQTYAMTEAMPIAANPIGSARKLQSVGPAAGSEIQICDGAGKPLACGVEGEVCVRGACVTVGYELRIHMREDPNHAAFHADANTTTRPDGSGVWIGYNPARAWLRTGDKGYVDGDTHVHLVGRFKEIINRGGEKISPFEIEHVLRAHAGVDDMIVFAVPHAQLGEVVGVAVVPRFPCFLTLEELRTFGVSEGLAPKWLPEALVLIQSVPKGATGKPARIGLATRLGIPELSVAGDATTRHGNDASEGGGSGSGSGASAYDSLALPGTRRGGTHATGAAYPNAHISGIVFVVVESVLLFHFCPRLSLRSSLYLLDICTWLSSHFGGMSLLFIASGLTTHLTHAKDDPAASCSAYGAFLWGRTQRLLLVAYAAQWSMLIAATQHPPSPPLGLGELDEYIFDARPLALSILLPTTLLYEPISSVLYDVNPGNTIYLSLEESFSLNAPAWFVGNLFVFWFAYPLASRCLRLIERQAGSVGLFAVTACLLILAAIAFKVVDYTEYVWHNAPLFFAGSTLAALATRHDALAEALQKKADDPVTGSTSTFDCAWSWACAHQTMLRGALADVTVVAVVLKTAYGFAYAPQRELNAEVTNWETAWWHSLSVLLFLIFLYGSCADGGAGLVARVMRHPLLLKLGDYSMALYMWQQLWFLGVFQIPYAHVTLPMGVRAEAQGTQAVIYNHILPGTNTTPPLLVGENVADLPARLDAIRFVAALLGIHAFAVVYVEWLEVPLLSARWLGEKAWWRRILL